MGTWGNVPTIKNLFLHKDVYTGMQHRIHVFSFLPEKREAFRGGKTQEKKEEENYDRRIYERPEQSGIWRLVPDRSRIGILDAGWFCNG
ncbi:MAG: hypothetical protein PUF59_08885 [Lachnospiraceae bacterium]|nr:hypothetical protein [Cuneatibacter sp.]MDD6456681.1 hypothetical protein [Lachnospiraceae bacterium]